MKIKQQATRYHDISCGHRVVGHEGKCRSLHGHNYRIFFTCSGTLDDVGRVIDFTVIKTILCVWLEENWDHKMLLWDQDPLTVLLECQSEVPSGDFMDYFDLIKLPFNPTAENLAVFLLKLGNDLLKGWRGDAVTLERVTVWETRKCCATAILEVQK